MQVDKKNIYILLGVIAVIIVIIIAALQVKKTQTYQPTTVPSVTQEATPDEVAPSKNAVDVATVTPEVLKGSTSMASGTSLITKDEKVVTPEGKPVKLNVMPSSADAPKESAPVVATKIPDNINNIKVSVSSAGFVPNTFKVKEGQLVNFVLTATDEYTHVFLFDDKSLIGAALGTGNFETRIKSWNAPKKGTYTFHCDIPGHASRGETGTMIVE